MDPTAGCLNVATLITELNDHWIQLKLTAPSRRSALQCRSRLLDIRQRCPTEEKHTILKTLTCSSFPCALALVPIPPSPRTDCYAHGHAQSLPGSHRARKPSSVIFFTGSTYRYGCNWDSGVADLASLSLAASVNISRFGCHKAFPAAFFHWLRSKAQGDRVHIDGFDFVLVCTCTHTELHLSS